MSPHDTIQQDPPGNMEMIKQNLIQQLHDHKMHDPVE